MCVFFPLFGLQYRNSHQDQFHNLSDCVLCCLPLFLMVTGASRKLPLTPFEATSYRATWQGVHSLKKKAQDWEQCNNAGIKADQTWVNLSGSGSLTMTGLAGASLDMNVSLEMCEVKSRLLFAVVGSGEPRSIGWSILVRLMVLWPLSGREGWSLSHAACRQCSGKKIGCVYVPHEFVHFACVKVALYLWNPTDIL